jgi:uncharacterized protein with PQ loop repeat
MVSSVVGAAIWTGVLVLVCTRDRLREMLLPAAFASVVVAAALVAGTTGVGVVLVTDTVLTTAPQLWRLRRSSAGVSTLTWAAIATAAACWVFYGVAENDLVLAVSQLVRLAAALAVVVTVTARGSTQRRHRVEAAAG